MKFLACPSRALWIAGAMWLVVVLGGLLVLINEASAPGNAGHVERRWPQASALRLDGDRPTLIMFLHPSCPCSRASVRELEHLLARVNGEVAATVVFIEHTRASSALSSDLWSTVAAIPGVNAVVDPDGLEGARFGVVTSGHTVLFSTNGELQYSGGLTSARGHEGESIGTAELLASIHKPAYAQASAPVFGCPLGTSTR